MKHDTGDFVSISRLRGKAPLLPDADPPGENDHPFHAALDLLRRRRLFVAVFALVGTALTGIAAFVVPPTYTATAQFMFEPTVAQTAAGALEPVVDTHIATISSDARLREVLGGLSALPEYQVIAERAAAQAADPGLADTIRTALVAGVKGIVDFVRPPTAAPEPAAPASTGVPSLEKVKNSLLVRQERRSNVIAVTYRDEDPERAAIIANQIVQAHVDRIEDRRRAQIRSLRTWLEARLTEAQTELDAAEEAHGAHLSTHGTPSADAAVGEPIAELARQLEVVRAELALREPRLAQVRAMQQAGAPPAAIANALRGRDVAGDRSVGTAPQTAAGAAPPDIDEGVRRLERDVDVLRSQARALNERYTSLQAASAAVLARGRDRQALERRVASIAETVRDLHRQQNEPKDAASTGVQFLAQATVPLAPSSLSPYLYIPAATLAFLVLGGLAASVRERMDRTFRGERDLASGLGIRCIGVVPTPPSSRQRKQAALRHLSLPFDRAIDAVAALAFELLQDSGEGRTLVVTSSRFGEGKSAVAAGIAAYAARAQKRVLLISADPAPVAQAPKAEGQAATPKVPFELCRDSDLGFDIVALNGTGTAGQGIATDAEWASTLGKLRDHYEHVVIDAPAVLESARVPLLAARCDLVLFAVRWGDTRRDVALNAVNLLTKLSALSGRPRPNIYSVLTHVRLRENARDARGEAAQFLCEGPRRGASSRFA